MSRDDSTQNKGDDDTQKQCYDSQTEVETTCASLSGVCIFANVCAQPGIASRAALAVSVSQSLSARATTASTHATPPAPFDEPPLNSSQMV